MGIINFEILMSVVGSLLEGKEKKKDFNARHYQLTVVLGSLPEGKKIFFTFLHHSVLDSKGEKKSKAGDPSVPFPSSTKHENTS